MHRRGGFPAPSRPPHRQKCSLGCPVLDSFLQGGIPCSSLTELVGECGSAKTQLCLQLLLAAQLPPSRGGLRASSLYLYTESYFPSRRLQQLAQAFVAAGVFDSNGTSFQKTSRQISQQEICDSRKDSTCKVDDPRDSVPSKEEASGWDEGSDDRPNQINALGIGASSKNSRLKPGDLQDWGNKSEDKCKVQANVSMEKNAMLRVGTGYGEGFDPCDNIFVQAIQTVEELFAFLDQAQLLLSQSLSMPVRLIVIDSIAALFRSDFDNTAKDLAKRTDWFFRVSSRLKFYAERFDLAVLVTNQVVDFVESEDANRGNALNEMLSGSFQPLISSGRRVLPALGLSWAHCVNTRLFLSRAFEVDFRTQSFNGSGAPPHSILGRQGSAQGITIIGKPEHDELDCIQMQESHTGVLRRLESELPDALLLWLSDDKATQGTSSRDVQSFQNDSRSSKPVRLALRRKAEEAGHFSFEGPVNSCNSAINFQSSPTTRLRRILQVVFAPHLPAMCCEFVVERDKIRGISSE